MEHPSQSPTLGQRKHDWYCKSLGMTDTKRDVNDPWGFSSATASRADTPSGEFERSSSMKEKRQSN
jgi:hypothetical protein